MAVIIGPISSGKSIFRLVLKYEEPIENIIEILAKISFAYKNIKAGFDTESNLMLVRELIYKYSWIRKMYKKVGSLHKLIEELYFEMNKDLESILDGSKEPEEFDGTIIFPGVYLKKYQKIEKITTEINKALKKHKKIFIFISPRFIYESFKKGSLISETKEGQVILEMLNYLKNFNEKNVYFVITMSDEEILAERLPKYVLDTLLNSMNLKAYFNIMELREELYLGQKGLYKHRNTFINELVKVVDENSLVSIYENGKLLKNKMIKNLKNFLVKKYPGLTQEYIEETLLESLKLLSPLKEIEVLKKDILNKYAELFEIFSIIDLINKSKIPEYFIEEIVYLSIFDKKSIKKLAKKIK